MYYRKNKIQINNIIRFHYYVREINKLIYNHYVREIHTLIYNLDENNLDFTSGKCRFYLEFTSCG